MSLLPVLGRLALTPLRNSGDLLHKTIWLTLSAVPAVQASFTSAPQHSAVNMGKGRKKSLRLVQIWAMCVCGLQFFSMCTYGLASAT